MKERASKLSRWAAGLALLVLGMLHIQSSTWRLWGAKHRTLKWGTASSSSSGSGVSPNKSEEPPKKFHLDPKSAKHWSTCKMRETGDCFKCKHLSNKYRWQQVFQIDANQPALGSWLTGKTKDGHFGIGCAICSLAKTGSSGALHMWDATSVLQTCFFKRHELTRMHQKALAEFLGQEPPKDRPATPSKEAFEAVLEHTKRAGAIFKGVKGVGGKNKTQKVQYCLAEAVREMQRRFFKRAESIAVHPDSKGMRYAARFSAADATLAVWKGTFGQVFHIPKGVGAMAIRTSLEDLITEFCTPRHGAPARRSTRSSKDAKRKRECDVELRSIIMDDIEIYDPDRVADEQSAGRSMRDDQSAFKRLKIVTHDHAHAARRTLILVVVCQ